MANELADNHIEPETKDHNDGTDDDCESHFINFSLLNTLFPNIELKRRLQGGSLVSQGLNVEPKPIVDRLKIGNSHQEKALESLTQVGCRGVHGVLSLVHKIEYFNNDRVLEEHVHVHFKHDIETILLFGHMENRLSHELVQLRDMLLS